MPYAVYMYTQYTYPIYPYNYKHFEWYMGAGKDKFSGKISDSEKGK